MSDDVNWISVPDEDDEADGTDDAGDGDFPEERTPDQDNPGIDQIGTDSSPDSADRAGSESTATPGTHGSKERTAFEGAGTGANLTAPDPDEADEGTGPVETDAGIEPVETDAVADPETDAAADPVEPHDAADPVETDEGASVEDPDDDGGETGDTGSETETTVGASTSTEERGETGRPIDPGTAPGDVSADDVEQRVKELIREQTDDEEEPAEARPADVDGERDDPVEAIREAEPTDAESGADGENSRPTSPDEGDDDAAELLLAARSGDGSWDGVADHGADGDAVEAITDPTSLRSVITERRIELVESVMAEPPSSIRALADRLGRDVKDVHGDVHRLAEFGVVEFDENGRAKQPTVPYDRVRVQVGIRASPDRSDAE